MTFAKTRLLPLAVALTYLCASVAAGEFRSNCNTAPCPSVLWADAAAGQTTAFVLTSSKRTSATNNWVSFAFADGPRMSQAQLVVDCYDIDGNLTMGTSKNAQASYDNKDSPADLSKLVNRTVRFDQGIYNCTFFMALPSASAYVILAEGLMDPSSSAGPKKRQHNVQWMSTAAFGFSLPAIPTPSTTVVASVTSASSPGSTRSTTFSTLTTTATYNSTNENSPASISSTTTRISINMSMTPTLSETSSIASTSQMHGNSTMAAPSVIDGRAQTNVDNPTNKTAASTKGKGSSANRVHQSWLVAVALLSACVAVKPLVRGR